MKIPLQSITLGLCLMAHAVASATPIVVGRVAGGFLIGSNYTRSDGSQACKLHYVGKRLLLIAGQPIAAKVVNPPAKPRVLFDIDKEVWPVLRDDLSDEKLLEAVQRVITHDIRTLWASPLFEQPKKPTPLNFAIVLLSTKGAEPIVWTQKIDFPDGHVPPVISVKKQSMAVGDILVWYEYEPEMLRQDVNYAVANIERILDHIRLDPQIPRNDHGYEPPFVVLSLDSSGLEFVKGDPAMHN